MRSCNIIIVGECLEKDDGIFIALCKTNVQGIKCFCPTINPYSIISLCL